MTTANRLFLIVLSVLAVSCISNKPLTKSEPQVIEITELHYIDHSAPIEPLNASIEVSLTPETLHLSAVIKDSSIVSTIRENGLPLYETDDVLELFLDPGADGLDYYELQINPHSHSWQLMLDKPYSDGGSRKNHPIKGLTIDTKIIEIGWQLEISLPLMSLQADKYALNIAYADHDNSSSKPAYYSWQNMGCVNLHQPNRWYLID